METAKSGSHTIWDCKYHLVWVTKYRYPVLVGDVGLRARELLREISRSHEMSIHAGAINRDHAHLLLSIPPHLSVSRAAQYLKGKSFHKLLTEYQSLRKRYWGQHLWSPPSILATTDAGPNSVSSATDTPSEAYGNSFPSGTAPRATQKGAAGSRAAGEHGQGLSPRRGSTSRGYG